jgi:hypothetical protein
MCKLKQAKSWDYEKISKKIACSKKVMETS